MMTRRAQIVRARGRAHAERGFGRDQDLLAPAGDRLAENGFGKSVRVNVSRVEEIHARFEADVDQARGLVHIACAPGAEEFVAPAKRARAKTQDGNLQSGTSKLSEFHIGDRCEWYSKDSQSQSLRNLAQ